MTPGTSNVVITGCGVRSPGGRGLEALERFVGASGTGAAAELEDVLDGEPLPAGARLVADFDVRRDLGRRGTSTFDRATSLAIMACGEALTDSGLTVDDGNRERVGISLATTTGSLRSICDYSRETLVAERPYLVNPILFPNTVMNCAAGQAAIWFGLRGVNSTIAGGANGFVGALRYTSNLLARGHVDAVLAGAVEEATAYAAWAGARFRDRRDVPLAEGAAVFVVERAHQAAARGGVPVAELLAAVTAYCPGGSENPELRDVVVGTIGRGLGAAGAASSAVARLWCCGAVEDGWAEELSAAFWPDPGSRPQVADCSALLGDARSAGAALAMAAVLAAHRDRPERDGEVSLVVSRTVEGAVGVAVVRGRSRAGSHRG